MAKKTMNSDEKYMKLALSLAQRGRGLVEPNPMVGAILVRNEKIIGQGWHRRFGSAHAEIEALWQAGARAAGATLYVTLEPCCHTGKTGPCTRALIEAGVKRVVAAMQDPFPEVCGKGFAVLRRAGVDVVVGVGRAEAQALNQPFIKRLTTGQPYVLAKWAQTLDGCVADRGNRSQWISAELARTQVHGLRSRMDAIMVGIGTVLADDPSLTARLPDGRAPLRCATRVIIDRDCQLPVTSKLVATALATPVLVVHRKNLNAAALARKENLIAHGVATLAVAINQRERLRLAAVLRQLAQRGMTNVLVEGGPRLLADLLFAHLVDEIHIYIAPKILGDVQARHAVEGPAQRRLAQAVGGTVLKMEQLGPDVHLVIRP